MAYEKNFQFSIFKGFDFILSIEYGPKISFRYSITVAHLSEKMLQCDSIYARGRADLLFSCEIEAPKVSLFDQYFSCTCSQRGCRTRPSIRGQDPNNITDTGARCLVYDNDNDDDGDGSLYDTKVRSSEHPVWRPSQSVG